MQECVERIKGSIDIVELIGRYLQLRRAGNSWKACCPFHNEKTPSFHVNPARQAFKCFGCGVGGDGVKFLMMFENLDYPTALRRIADMNGIPVIEEEENPEAARLRQLRSRIIQLNTLAADYFHRKLCRDKAAAHVREYLKQREFNIDIAKAWELGWAPPEIPRARRYRLVPRHGFPPAGGCLPAGQQQPRAYPVFRDRLMFPIRNVRGEVVGFSGRIMQEDQDPRKYVNTAETAAFRKENSSSASTRPPGPSARPACAWLSARASWTSLPAMKRQTSATPWQVWEPRSPMSTPRCSTSTPRRPFCAMTATTPASRPVKRPSASLPKWAWRSTRLPCPRGRPGFPYQAQRSGSPARRH